MKRIKQAYIVVIGLLVVGVLALVMIKDVKRVRASSLIVVTDSGDSGTGTLRQAVIDAVDGDTIQFSPSSFPTITLTGGQITIDKSLMIEGPGANLLTVMRDSGAGPFRIFQVNSGKTVTIAGLTISGGSADFGGGILTGGTLTINSCTLSGNSANQSGGGILNVGMLTILNSTFSDNTAGFGGGIFNGQGATTTINNSTFSSNSADTGFGGGGIANLGALTINNSTIANNSAGTAGGIHSFGALAGHALNLNSSIVANNFGNVIGRDILGPISSGDYNLIRHAIGILNALPGTHNITGRDPMLGPLAFNGGSTMTLALRCGSPAIDQGNNSGMLVSDQRGSGFGRTFNDIFVVDAGDGTDIGAFEVQAASSIACPANLTVVTATIGGSGMVVTYPSPTLCPDVTAICNPPSGSTFPVGCSTVTCAAIDASGKTATCTFTVCVFNVCLQDDSNSSNRILINTLTGDYRFCCGGVTYSGRGKIAQRGSNYSLDHVAVDRRVRASITGTSRMGNASLQSPAGTPRCVVGDSDTRNNTTCKSCR